MIGSAKKEALTGKESGSDLPMTPQASNSRHGFLAKSGIGLRS
jgi:hypothetical protein